MTAAYAHHFSARQTSQSQPIPGTNQVPNSAGGYAFPVTDWVRLERFLILGVEGNSLYASEKQLTVENAQAAVKCLADNPRRVVDMVVAVSDAGRAPKNDAALFVLAMAASQRFVSCAAYRSYALNALAKVARTGTHLFQFVENVKHFRGHGRALNRAIGSWYTSKEPRALAYQVSKYQQRNGWTHRDLLRLCRPSGIARGTSHDEIVHWCVHGWPGVGDAPHDNKNLLPIWAMEKAKRSTNVAEIVSLIRDHDLVRECVPTAWLKQAEVWGALLERMPLTALIRNLATMTRVGLLAPLSAGVGKVLGKLLDGEGLRASRVHPIQVLAAMLTYASGRSAKGDGTWQPVSQVVDALDGAFYRAFGNVPATGKRWLLALDVSGSMDRGVVAGVPGLTPRVASAALAMVTAAVEQQHHFVAFTSGGWQSSEAGASQWAGHGISNGITPLTISPRQRLTDVCRQVGKLPMGGTDCALPMLWAEANKVPADVFVVLTDSETWCNPHIHPCQALQRYRRAMGIPAKLIVVSMLPNAYSIADPDDAGMLDVVGFDLDTPAAMAEFVRG